MNHYFKIFCFAILTFYSICFSTAVAEDRLISENQAKAAFVFNVVRYVTWPPPDSNTVLIGILGKGPLSREWQSISGKTLSNRKLHVVKSNDVDEMLDCQLVVIEETSPNKLSRSLQKLRHYPILTIGDSPVFISSGGALNIAFLNNRISFSINLAQARASGLTISSNLLKLAIEVVK
jgi:hypothetical protein